MEVSTIYGLRLVGYDTTVYVGKTSASLQYRLQKHIAASRAIGRKSLLISKWIAARAANGDQVEIYPILKVEFLGADGCRLIGSYWTLVRQAERSVIGRVATDMLREDGVLLLNGSCNPFRLRGTMQPDFEAIRAAIASFRQTSVDAAAWSVERDVICPEDDCRPVVAA